MTGRSGAILRSGAFALGLVALTVVLGVFGLPVLILPRRLASRFGRFWSGAVLAWLRLSTGISYRVRGREFMPAGPAIYAFKHQSALETLALHHILRDPAIVCKRELLRIPVFGWYLRASGVIAIDRAAGAAALRQMVVAAERALAQGRSVAIFPEGTRGALGSHLPYQPGVGLLYAQLGIPVVPVALDTGRYWRPGWFDKRPGRATIEMLPPIEPGLPRRAIVARLETAIETATARLLGPEASAIASAEARLDTGAASE